MGFHLNNFMRTFMKKMLLSFALVMLLPTLSFADKLCVNDRVVTKSHDAGVIVAVYPDNTADIRLDVGVIGNYPLRQISKIQNKINGFYVGERVVTKSHDAGVIVVVYPDNTADIRLDVGVIGNYPLEQISEIQNKINGFYVGERVVTKSHDAGVIVVVYPDNTADIRLDVGVIGNYPLEQISEIQNKINGFYVGERVVTKSHDAGVIVVVYPDNTADIRLDVGVIGNYPLEQISEIQNKINGFYVGERVVTKSHDAGVIVVVYPDNTADIRLDVGVIGNYPLEQISEIQNKINGFYVGERVVTKSHDAGVIVVVYPDNTADIRLDVGVIGNYPLEQISEIQNKINGFYVGERVVTKSHDAGVIVVVYPDNTADIRLDVGVIGNYPLEQISEIQNKINGFYVGERVVTKSHDAGVIVVVYPDNTADIRLDVGVIGNYPLEQISEIQNKINGFYVGERVVTKSHDAGVIVVVYPDNTADIRLDVGVIGNYPLEQISEIQNKINGFYVGERVVTKSHDAGVIVVVYPDNTADIRLDVGVIGNYPLEQISEIQNKINGFYVGERVVTKSHDAGVIVVVYPDNTADIRLDVGVIGNYPLEQISEIQNKINGFYVGERVVTKSHDAGVIVVVYPDNTADIRLDVGVIGNYPLEQISEIQNKINGFYVGERVVTKSHDAGVIVVVYPDNTADIRLDVGVIGNYPLEQISEIQNKINGFYVGERVVTKSHDAGVIVVVYPDNTADIRLDVGVIGNYPLEQISEIQNVIKGFYVGERVVTKSHDAGVIVVVYPDNTADIRLDVGVIGNYPMEQISEIQNGIKGFYVGDRVVTKSHDAGVIVVVYPDNTADIRLDVGVIGN